MNLVQLKHFPMSTFCRADAFDDAIGFKFGKMFFYCFGCDADLFAE